MRSDSMIGQHPLRGEMFRMSGMAAVVACATLLAACGKSGNTANRAAAAPPAKSAGQSSLIGSERVVDLAALHDTVAARAARGDTVGLLRLMVNDSVYRAVVWPTMPSYEPGREEVWNLVMSMHKPNSNKGLRRLLHDIAQPEAGPVIRLPLTPKPVEGGRLHESAKATPNTPSLTGVVLFGSALCLETSGCQVLSYAQGGQRGAGISPEPEN
jgi:hypothetical protein